MISLIDRASLGFLIRHPWQLALALAGICVGVAVVIAVDLANESSRKAFLQSMATVNGAATHQIIGGPAGLDESVYVALRRQGGFRNTAPIVSGYVDVASVSLQVLGVDVFAERGFRDFSSLGNANATLTGAADAGAAETSLRRLLTEPGAVVMSRGTAQTLGLDVDGRFELEADGRTHAAILAGVYSVSGASSGNLQDILVTDIATAQTWLDKQGLLSRIDVRADGPDAAAVLGAMSAYLPPGVQLLNADARTRATLDMSAAFNTNLTAMSLLALLVGIFLIYNSVSFAVLQRRRLIGTLRALGVTRGQTVALILKEALVLGIVGSALGLVVGTWLAEQLLVLVSQSINDLYFRVNATDVSVGPAALIKGVAAGVTATLCAAAVPAIEAAAYEPRLTMLRSSLERRAGSLVPVITIAGLAAATASLILVRLSGQSLLAGLTALFMLIMGLALCIPAAMRLAAGLLEGVAARIGGIPARLAVSGVTASVSRTAVAVVAMAVAMSTTIGVSTMVDSFRSSVVAWLDNTLQSDIYIAVPGGTIDAGLVAELTRLPGVTNFSTARRAWIESPSGRTRLIAVQMAPRSFDGTRIVAGNAERAWRLFAEGAVMLAEPYAYRHGLEPGDRLSLMTGTGERQFPVAGVYRSYDSGQGAVLMSYATFINFWEDPGVASMGLYLDDDVAAAQVIAAARQRSENRQALSIRSNRDIRQISLEIFDQTFIITNVLYWLALSVAIIGILGAMLAVQIERSVELATLRALGMSTLQVGRMVISQTGFIGLLSGLAAVPLGVLMAWMLIRVINRRAFGWQLDIVISPTVLGTAVVLSVAAALLAGLYPAFLAAKSQPALAMRDE